MIFQDNLLVYGTTKEQFDKRMLAVKSRLREKKRLMRKNLTQNQSIALVYWDTPFQLEGKAPDPKDVEKINNAKAPTNKKQLESFDGLANFSQRVIPDFATKMLTLNNMRNGDFL